ncbi:COMM domain-containing protein 9 isoform X2 [Oryzias latipes]|uniref:COMM domain-containing protein 9 isoform X2 n=1 Tax=Oryzias latipes TaxID=8090 RepID=UPI0005CB85BA|nr:COMM domain-containing protein 9 isoform X2 [Oryzias latipes]
MAATVSSEVFSDLQLLLKAPSKDVVREVCVQSHSGPSRQLTDNTAAALSISAAQAAQLVQSLHTLSHHILFYNLSSPEQILSIFPETFHSSLKNLITKILLENSPAWRTGALDKQAILRLSSRTFFSQMPARTRNMKTYMDQNGAEWGACGAPTVAAMSLLQAFFQLHYFVCSRFTI